MGYEFERVAYMADPASVGLPNRRATEREAHAALARRDRLPYAAQISGEHGHVLDRVIRARMAARGEDYCTAFRAVRHDPDHADLVRNYGSEIDLSFRGER